MPRPHANRADANGNRRRRTGRESRQGRLATTRRRAAANEKIMDFALNFLAVEVSLHKISGTRKIQSKLYLRSLALSLHKISGTRQSVGKLTCRSLAASLHRQTGSGGTGGAPAATAGPPKGHITHRLWFHLKTIITTGHTQRCCNDWLRQTKSGHCPTGPTNSAKAQRPR